MRIIIFLMILIMTGCMSEDSSAGPSVIGQAGSMSRFSIVDSVLVVVKPNQLQTWSIADKDDPKLMGELDAGNDVETVYAIDTTLFIGSETGMIIYSMETPWQPRFRSSFTHWRSCDPVFVQDTVAFVTTRSGNFCWGGENKLYTVNVTNLDSAYEMMSWDMVNPHGLGVDDSLLFVADGVAGLKVFNIKSPTEIELLEVINMGSAYDVIVNDGDLTVIADDALYQYDYSALPLKELSRFALFPVNQNL